MFWNIVLAVAAFALQLLLMPKPQNAKPSSLDDVEAPTAEEGIEIPVLFGTKLLKGPNVVWYGDFNAVPIKGPRRYGFFGPRQIIGHRYFLGIQMVMCHGPADYLYEIILGEDKELWIGNSAGGRIVINKPNILGENQGGIAGDVDLDMGDPDQGQNDYLVSVLGEGVPAYRGVVSVTLRQVELGRNTYIQPWSFLLQRIYKTSEGEEQWYPEKAGIGDSSTFVPEVNQIPDPHAGSMFLSPQDIYDGYVVTPINGGAVAYKYPDFNSRVWTTTGLPSSAQACCIGDDTGTVFICHQQNALIVALDLRTGEPKGTTTLSGFYSGNAGISSITIDGTTSGVLGGTKVTYVFVHKGNTLYLCRYTGNSVTPLTEVDKVDPGYSFISSSVQFAISPSRVYMVKGGSSLSEKKVLIINWSSFGFGVVTEITLSDLLGNINFLVYHKDYDKVFIHDDGGSIHAYSPDLTTKLYSSTEAGNAVNQYMVGARRKIDQNGRIVYRTSRDDGNWIVAFNPADLSVSFDVNVEEVYGWTNSAYGPSAVDPLSDFMITGGTSGVALMRVMDIPEFERFYDMNPAHIIRECLTDTNWGMGYNDSDIDDVSFTAAADALFDEGFGLSMLWNREEEIQEFVTMVISHIDAVLYVSRRTGKFVLKLIRNDYDIDEILVVTEDDVVSWDEVSRRQPAEAINSVIVKFWDREKYDETSHSIHNTAQIQQLGNMVPTTRQYPAITKSSLAVRVGLRDLKSLGIGFISGRLQGKRTLEDLNPGDPFRLVSDEHDLSGQVMRVVDMKLGDGRSNRISFKFTEDIFHLSDDVLVDYASSDWENPHNPPQPIINQLAQEMPYFDLLRFIGAADLATALTANPDMGMLQVAASSPATGSINALLAVDPATGTWETNEEHVEFCPVAELNGDLSFSGTEIVVRNDENLSAVTVGTLALIGEEIVRIDAVSGTTLTIGRGCLDTVPAAHVDGDVILFYDTFSESNFDSYDADQNVGVRLLTVTGIDTLGLYDALESRVTFDSRAIRPLRPADVKIEGDPVGPIDAQVLSEINVTWSNRNRLTETSPLSWVDATVTPETGQTTTIDILALDGVTVLDNITGLTGTSHTIPIGAFDGNSAGIIRVYSERDGYASLKHHDIVVFVDSGYGYSYGYNYGGA